MTCYKTCFVLDATVSFFPSFFSTTELLDNFWRVCRSFNRPFPLVSPSRWKHKGDLCHEEKLWQGSKATFGKGFVAMDLERGMKKKSDSRGVDEDYEAHTVANKNGIPRQR